MLTLMSIVISWFVSFIILKLNKESFTDISQKFHAIHKEPIPRIGGISILIPFLLASFWIGSQFSIRVLLLATTAFGIGFIKDLRKNISPKLRLVFLFLISMLTVLVLDVKIDTIGFLNLPSSIAIPLTLVAIAGFTNAINIIDGLNGLASGISVTFLFFLGLAFYEYGIPDVALICFTVIGGIIGFLVFNFPHGRIFLDDGGSYFLGFTCAVLSIKLINLVPEISPWFPLILGVYPVWEVLFSAYRRTRKGKHPFHPDKLHLHTLVYYRITRSNPKASALIVGVNFALSLIAFLVKTCTLCLMVEFCVFIAVYMATYKRLVRIV